MIQNIFIPVVFLLIPLFIAKPAFAQVDCSTYKGSGGPHASGKMNGNSCNIPSQYNTVLKCIGTSGNRYIVTYCTSFGCEEEYPEQGPNAPALCNRPDQSQSDIGKVFGQIIPPVAIQNFGFGSAGIGKFLSNLITLIYIFAIIVLIFMLLWGAFDWMLSEGNKEKLQAAQNKIINAIIGILLFAVAFAIIQILGQFTGFKFFVGQ